MPRSHRTPGASSGAITGMQRAVIERLEATHVTPGSAVYKGSLFLYVESEHGCTRYLIDRGGRVLDHERFKRHAA